MPSTYRTPVTAYPPAERRPVVDHLHGLEVHDPYRWLEDASSMETKVWLAAQDDLWWRRRDSLPGRDRLSARVAELADVGMITAPMWRGDRQFFLRQRAQDEHAVLHTVAPDGTEAVLIDPMALDPGGTTTLDHWQPDLDGRLLAFQVSRHGDEQSHLHVMDVGPRQVVDGPIDGCRSSPVAWLPGGEAFYYIRAVPDGRTHPRGVYLHRVGNPAVADALVYGSGRDESSSYGLGISRDGRWLTISAAGGPAESNDLWLADLSTSSWTQPDLQVVHEGVNARTALDVGRDGRMYVVTTLGSPRGRLCVGDPTDPRPDAWSDLVPADPEAVLCDFAVLDGPELAQPVVLVGRTRHALSEISVHDLATGAHLGEVPLPGPGAAGPLATRLTGGYEAWFTVSNSVTPQSVYRYDARTGETTLWAGPPGSVAVPETESQQIVYTSADGTPVRMVVLARRGSTGPRPTILYGYGGFGVPLTPSYSGFTLAWVEAGGVFAIANLRGGGEEGEEWHRAGMLDRKQNVFDDFAAAAERLIANGWTTAGQLGICGESNGGLLVGAALTQRPELFAAAVCSAPVLDMVRYERFGLGSAWRGEYGTADDPDQLRYLLSYSPYHRVRAGVDYPAVLFTVFGNDSRVDPLHARKMAAALQWATAGGRPILLRHEDDVGHGDAAASRGIALAADMLAFLAAHTGLDLAAPADAGRERPDPDGADLADHAGASTSAR